MPPVASRQLSLASTELRSPQSRRQPRPFTRTGGRIYYAIRKIRPSRPTKGSLVGLRGLKRGESPYSLAFGTEVILPLEVVFPTLWIEHFTPRASEADLRENLDLLEECRAETHLTTLHYQRAMALLYNRKVRPQSISMGDLVLRKAEVSNPEHSREKLTPRWEGPYRIIRVI
ncbi:hypothetical protein BHM03_00042716 [Ensete ventricosum]|nr:hypothetical protein BHM03_00042716 [Ensete ventricosum]